MFELVARVVWSVGAVAVICALLGGAPGEAGADQLVQDPSFELGSPNPYWSEGGLYGGIVCDGEGSRTGACYVVSATSAPPFPTDCWVSQVVAFPGGGTATARFCPPHTAGMSMDSRRTTSATASSVTALLRIAGSLSACSPSS